MRQKQYRPFRHNSSILICFGQQQLVLAEINHVIYFDQSQLLFTETNENNVVLSVRHLLSLGNVDGLCYNASIQTCTAWHLARPILSFNQAIAIYIYMYIHQYQYVHRVYMAIRMSYQVGTK